MVDVTNILIIDDVETSRAALKQAIGGVSRIYEADGGKSGLAMLERIPDMDLILLDLIMPEMSGLEFLKIVKQDERFAGIPVIVCTAADDEETEEEALRIGAEDFLTKPFRPNVVRLRVENTLRRKALEIQSRQWEVDERMRELVDNIPVGIGIMAIERKSMRPVYINEKAKELFGLNHVESALWDKDAAFIEMNRHDLNRIMSSGKEEVIRNIYTAHRTDGRAFKIQSIARMQPQKDGTMFCYAALTDIMEREKK